MKKERKKERNKQTKKRPQYLAAETNLNFKKMMIRLYEVDMFCV